MKPTRQARIIADYKAQYENPIQVASGERVTVGREDEEFPGWVWCTASDGRSGWVPMELIANHEGAAMVVDDYSAKELSVKVGDIVKVKDARRDWLLVEKANNETGWIPASHARPCGES